MVRWKEFAPDEGDLAERGRSLLFHGPGIGPAFLATVRKDGAPRLHPVCPVLSNDRLVVLVTPASPTRHALVRTAGTLFRRSRSPSLEATSSTSRARLAWLTCRPS